MYGKKAKEFGVSLDDSYISVRRVVVEIALVRTPFFTLILTSRRQVFIWGGHVGSLVRTPFFTHMLKPRRRIRVWDESLYRMDTLAR